MREVPTRVPVLDEGCLPATDVQRTSTEGRIVTPDRVTPPIAPDEAVPNSARETDAASKSTALSVGYQSDGAGEQGVPVWRFDGGYTDAWTYAAGSVSERLGEPGRWFPEPTAARLVEAERALAEVRVYEDEWRLAAYEARAERDARIDPDDVLLRQRIADIITNGVTQEQMDAASGYGERATIAAIIAALRGQRNDQGAS